MSLANGIEGSSRLPKSQNIKIIQINSKIPLKLKDFIPNQHNDNEILSDNSSDFYDDFSLAASNIFKVNPYHDRQSNKSAESEYDQQEDESINENQNNS